MTTKILWLVGVMIGFLFSFFLFFYYNTPLVFSVSESSLIVGTCSLEDSHACLRRAVGIGAGRGAVEGGSYNITRTSHRFGRVSDADYFYPEELLSVWFIGCVEHGCCWWALWELETPGGGVLPMPPKGEKRQVARGVCDITLS